MKSLPIIIAAATSVSISACSTLSEDLEVEHRATSQWMIEQERAWADMACGGKWVASAVLADDFKGTAPNGNRYGKPTGQPTYEQNTKWSTDCSLDEADVRFFGSGAAWFGRIRGFGAMASGKSLPFKTTESSVLQSDALPNFGSNGRVVNELAVVLLRRAARPWREATGITASQPSPYAPPGRSTSTYVEMGRRYS